MPRQRPPSNVNRHSWRPTKALLDAILAHQFELENFSELCDRLLRYLAQEIDAGRTTQFKIPAEYKVSGGAGKSFRSGEIATSLLKDYKQVSAQATYDYLLGWASSLPKIDPIKNEEKALRFIRSNLPGKRILTAEAKAVLEQRCSDKTARKLLWSLHQSGEIRLVREQDQNGVQLGSPPRTYKFIDFLDAE